MDNIAERNGAAFPDSHFTWRSVVAGCVIGSIMCLSNMYFGLQSGWISMMSLQSSLLGFAMFKAAKPWLSKEFTAVENVLIQTTAVSVGTMPLAAGYVSIIPALHKLYLDDTYTGQKVNLNFPQLVLWGLAIAFFGVFLVIPLRKQMIVREKLKFPSGTATAEMISLLHSTAESDDEQDWVRKWSVFKVSFGVSSLYTLASYFLPVLYSLPLLNLFHSKAAFWNWFVTPSLSYVGQGMIMGVRPGISMFLGVVIGWGFLAPFSAMKGWAPGKVNDWKDGPRGWILYIALAIMIVEAIVTLVLLLARVSSHFFKLASKGGGEYAQRHAADGEENENIHPRHLVPNWMSIGGLIFSVVLCIAIVCPMFSMPVWAAFVAVVFACFISILGVRALGETDLNPVSGIGKISQLVFALVLPGNTLANIIAGGIAEAGAQQSGDLMQDLKTGSLIGASPRAQFYGQMIGSFLSVVVSAAVYLLYDHIYTIPNAQFPAPSAQIWLDMSRMVTGASLPPHVLPFALGFGIAFGIIPIFTTLFPPKHKQIWTYYLPNATAFAIGFYLPPNYVLPRVFGAIVVPYVYRHFRLRKLSPRALPILNNGDAVDDDSKSESLLSSQTRTPIIRRRASNDIHGPPEDIESLPTSPNVISDAIENLSGHHQSEALKSINASLLLIASGLVLGEGTLSIVNMCLKSFHVPVLSCWGCVDGICPPQECQLF